MQEIFELLDIYKKIHPRFTTKMDKNKINEKNKQCCEKWGVQSPNPYVLLTISYNINSSCTPISCSSFNFYAHISGKIL